MENMENVKPQEELAFIRRIMADSRGQVADDGKPSIVWGIIVVLGMLFNYYEGYMHALTGQRQYAGWVWLGLCLLGLVYIYWHVRTQNRRQRSKTFAGRVAGAIWGAVGVSMSIFIAATIIGYSLDRTIALHPIFICTVTSLILGIGYFVSGILYEISWLRWVAIGWWASSVIYVFWPRADALLVYAAAMIVLQIIPGVILLRKYRTTYSA